MNGAESLMRAAVEAGVEVCLTNPGTTEMPLVSALDSVPGVRGVLGLFEGVVTGAADGYGRMADKPALTLLHLGPGLGNGIANLHNARRARTPVVNLIGDHPTWHRGYDPPLASDIETLARPVSGWVRTSASASDLSRDTAEAIAAASQGLVATLVVPCDCQWDAGQAAPPTEVSPAPGVENGALEAARDALRGDGDTLLLLGSRGLRTPGLGAAARIAAATGCRLVCETFPARLERGPDLPRLQRLPYFPEQMQDFFAGVSRVVLAGATEPIAFFGYPEGISRMVPDSIPVAVLAAPTDDVEGALEDLADAVGAPARVPASRVERPDRPTGELRPRSIAQALAALQPEGAIVMDEGITAAGGYYPSTVGCPPHTYLTLTGGSIGLGLPCASGAALACPDRQVIALEGDGSAMYTIQALWTQARESLNVVNLIFANDRYRILQLELRRAGVAEPGPQSTALTDLAEPSLDWVALSRSMGVPASSAKSADELVGALERALAEPGPCLIEVRVP
jgi:acetolactate synthase-1/2/3 large subunit